MSTIIMAACWPLEGMSPAQKAVLISLADQASDDGVCWPGVGTIAKRTCLSERAVQEALAWLQAVGLVFRTYRANTSTSYTVSPKNYDPTKAPAPRGRAKNRGADGAPGANGAPPADGAPGGADGAPPGANGAPPEVRMAHPNRQLNHQGTVSEPLRSAAPPAAVKVAAEQVSEEETALQAACKHTWAAYSNAYEQRYGAKPVRNQPVNSKIKQFVQRLGYEEAPQVARFYVERVMERLVVTKCHEVGLLLSGAEGYRMQWITGQTMTNTRAAQADKTQANHDAAAEAVALLRARRGMAHAE